MNKKLCVIAAAVALAMTLVTLPAGAEMIFQGAVTSSATEFVAAPYGGIVDQLDVAAGDRVEKGDEVAILETTKVYASCEGRISGVFGEEGDSTEGITERYGAVLYIEPTSKYTITASTEKAYNASENKFIHIGEDVYLSCTADGSHQGRGMVTGFSEDGTKYYVEVIAGEFCMEETVGIFRKSDFSASSRIGRGTVAATSPVQVKGAGSILRMHVKSGDTVERGELLFETVDGNLDGLYSPGGSIVSTVSGIVATVEAAVGTAVEKNGKLITVYPDDAIEVQVPVNESDLSMISVGQKVTIEFSWDQEQNTRFNGTVTGISYLNSGAEDSEPVYTASVAFTPDSTVRLGMTVLVYAQDAPEEEAGDDSKTDASNN